MSKTMKTRALMLIDVQRGFLDTSPSALQNLRSATENAARLLDHARASGDLPIHVHNAPVGGHPPYLSAAREAVGMSARLQPVEREPVILKRSANPFTNTDLHGLLADRGVSEVAICGALSHLCVDTAARAARDLGYGVTVIHDACATHDLNFRGATVPADQVHAAFMAALEAAVAQTVSTRDFIESDTLDAGQLRNA